MIWKVNIRLPDEVRNRSTYDKVQRIDFLGSSTLVGTVGSLLLGFSLKSTEELPWSHPLIWGLFIASAVCCVGFVYVETNVSPYPVMPMRLITRRTPLFVSLSNLYVRILFLHLFLGLRLFPRSFGSVAAFSVVCFSLIFEALALTVLLHAAVQRTSGMILISSALTVC